MKLKTRIFMATLILVTSFAFAQTTTKKVTRRATRSVEQAEKTVNNTNEQIDSTLVGLDNTIEGAKKTAKKVSDLLFVKKNKAVKNVIIISITPTSYDNKNVNQLCHEISKTKAGKDLTKTFANGQMTIKIESKTNADAIWQKVSEETRKNFNIDQISEKSITLNLKQ